MTSLKLRHFRQRLAEFHSAWKSGSLTWIPKSTFRCSPSLLFADFWIVRPIASFEQRLLQRPSTAFLFPPKFPPLSTSLPSSSRRPNRDLSASSRFVPLASQIEGARVGGWQRRGCSDEIRIQLKRPWREAETGTRGWRWLQMRSRGKIRPGFWGLAQGAELCAEAKFCEILAGEELFGDTERSFLQPAGETALEMSGSWSALGRATRIGGLLVLRDLLGIAITKK